MPGSILWYYGHLLRGVNMSVHQKGTVELLSEA